MTRDRDLGRLLDLWLADGYDEVNDRVLDLVEDRISQQHQRPFWRASWRNSQMNVNLKVAAGLAASVAIAIATWRLLPSTTLPPGATPTQATSPSATPVPTEAAQQWWLWEPAEEGGVVAIDVCGDAPTPPGCAGELAAGTYTSAGFDPAITYTVPAGWVNGRDWANDFSLFPGTPFARGMFPDVGVPAAEIAVHLIDRDGLVCPPTFAAPSPGPLGTEPSEIVDYIARTQFFGSERNRAAVTVGGLPGEQVEFMDAPGWTCESRPAGGSSPFDDRLIVVALPDGRALAIEILKAGFAGVDVDYDQLVREAMPIVLGFRFEGAG